MKKKTNIINGLEFTEAYRQGEILIFKLKDTSARPHPHQRIQRIDSNVIRTGEKEGHQHKVVGDAQLNMFPDTQAPTPGESQEQASQGVLEVGKAGAEVIHPEHGPIKLKKGKYIVQTQKEAVGKNKEQRVKD
ncbi:MAG: hypothetical protein WCS94_14145 [Verrucomicrobiota bacterium]